MEHEKNHNDIPNNNINENVLINFCRSQKLITGF